MPNPIPNETRPSTLDPQYFDALASLRPMLLAIPESEIQRNSRLDPSVAAMIAEASAKALVDHKPALVAQYGASLGTLIDELPVVARGARQADIDLAAAASSADIAAMHELVRAEYQLLITDTESLANRKLIEPKRLEAARDLKGYHAVLRSLLVVLSILREHWEQIKNETPIKEADILRAEATAQRMSAALGERDAGLTRAPAAEMRIRALSKLIAHYEEIRRNVTHMRWYEHDVDSITPSLWSGRGGRGRSSDDGTDTDAPVTPAVGDAPVTPVTPGPVNGGGPFTA